MARVQVLSTDEPDVEEQDDGSVVVDLRPPGDRRDEEAAAKAEQHDANLAETLPESQVASICQDLLGLFTADYRSVEEWRNTIKKGLRLLGVRIEEINEPFTGACAATFPLILDAAYQFQGRAFGEMMGQNEGPVKTRIMGSVTPEKQGAAERVAEYMNYQLTEEMSEWAEDLDRMLFVLALVGSMFKKVYYDEDLGRPVSAVVDIEDFVVGYWNTDLRTCGRCTQVIRMSENELQRKVAAGAYRDLEGLQAARDDDLDRPVRDVVDMVEGRHKQTDADDDRHLLLEMHVDLPEIDDDIALPYIVTIHADAQKVLSIRRNWEEDDPKRKRLQWFVHYRFLPGLGFYGFGLVHLLGNLQAAVTAIMRAMVDAGLFSIMPGGFKSKGIKTQDGRITPGWGEWIEAENYGEDLSKAFLPLPTKEPSQALFQVMDLVVTAGRRMASISDVMVGDINSNETPATTVMAQIEQAQHLMTAVHKRLHMAQKDEFRLLARINATNLPTMYPYMIEGATREIKAEDFSDRVDVVPQSDPNMPNQTQRMVQAQAQLQLASAFPQQHNLREALYRVHTTIRTPKIDNILMPETGPKPMDPADQVFAILHGRPVMAYPHQNHQAHVQALMAAMQNPQLLGNPIAQQQFGPAALALIADHTAHLYRQQLEAAAGVPLPPAPHYDPTNPGKDDGWQPLPPQLEQQIAQRMGLAAQQLSQQAQQMAQMQQNQQAAQDPLIQIEQQKVQVQMHEAETKRMDVQMKHGNEPIKAQVEMQKAAHKMQVDQQKAELEMRKKELELQLKAVEAQLKMETERQKAHMDQQRTHMEMANDQQRMAMDAQHAQMEHHQQMEQSRQQHEQALSVNQQMGQTKVDQTRQMGEAKVQQARAMARTKPKPTGNKTKT